VWLAARRHGEVAGRNPVTKRREVTLSTSALARPVSLSLRPATARRQVQALLRDEDWPGDADAVVLALHEALVNASRHGGGARRAEAAVDGAELVITVWDRGSRFDPRPFAHRSTDPMAERGRGLWLISQLATDYDVHSTAQGNELTMRFARP
jgi:anti-sigma regulatory factor (Ser/Thr protein kinase)